MSSGHRQHLYPSPCPHLRRRHRPAQVVALHAVSVGTSPCGRCCCLRAAPHELATPPRTGTAPARGRSCQRPPLQVVALAAMLPLAALQRAATTCGLAVGGCPLRAGRSRSCPRGCCPCGWPPLAGGPWLQLAAPCKGPGRSQPPPCSGALAAAGRNSRPLEGVP
ncbi:hypothetical protein GW17_00022684 [Ensete ventricosum]|nr:hypothetical protein GW17_00022684 [Ensete ventricosum]